MPKATVRSTTRVIEETVVVKKEISIPESVTLELSLEEAHFLHEFFGSMNELVVGNPAGPRIYNALYSALRGITFANDARHNGTELHRRYFEDHPEIT